jgi:hypothetical protein
VFDWNGLAWVQRGMDLNGAGFHVGFGSSISLLADGRRLAVGSPTKDVNFVDDAEAAVFDWNGLAWQQVGQSLRDGVDNLDPNLLVTPPAGLSRGRSRATHA